MTTEGYAQAGPDNNTPRTVLVAPLGKGMIDHHGLLASLVERLARRGPTVSIEPYADPAAGGVVPMRHVLDGGTVSSRDVIGEFEGEKGRTGPLVTAAHVVQVTQELRRRGFSVVIEAPHLLPGRQAVHAGSLPLADYAVYGCDPQQLADWATLGAEVFALVREADVRMTLVVAGIPMDGEDVWGRPDVQRLVSTVDRVLDLSDLNAVEPLFPGLSEAIGLSADEPEQEEAIRAEVHRADIACRPLVARLNELIRESVDAPDGQWQFGRFHDEVDVATLTRLANLLASGVDVLTHHRRAFLHADLYLGGFWLDAFAFVGAASELIVDKAPAATTRMTLLSLVEAFSYTYDQACDVTIRGATAIQSLLAAGDDHALDRVAVAYAAAISNDFADAVGDLRSRLTA